MKKKKRAKAKTAPKVKHAKKLSLFVVIPLILVSLFVFAATTYKIVEIILINNSSTNFPKLEISLAEAPIEQIDANSKDVKYSNNTVTFTINGDSSTYEGVEIKGRGNATWTQAKKPYQIKLEKKEGLFNLGESKKWILLANYFDPSHLRTDIAYYLESILKIDYPLHGRFLELYTDGIYKGLYYLSEKIENDKSRINLKDDLGIIVEVDNLHGTPNDCIYSSKHTCIVVQDSVSKNSPEMAMDDFMENFNELELAASKKNFKEISQLIDVDSFAKYYLLNEFLINPDAYSSSFFLYKDGTESKIYAGPGWDFDYSLGNPQWGADGIDYEIFHSPFTNTTPKDYIANNTSPNLHAASISPLLYNLMEVPEFKNRVKEIYQETFSGKGEDLLEYVQSQANYIRPAALRDQKRWKLKTDFDEEVDYLIDWIAKRYDHFEQTYGTNSN